MSFTFERPVKAALDVKELEYVVSLLQSDHSDEEHFRDGSVDGECVLYMYGQSSYFSH